MLREGEQSWGQQSCILLWQNTRLLTPNPVVLPPEQIWKVPEDFSDEVNRETGGLAAISKVYSNLVNEYSLITD